MFAPYPNNLFIGCLQAGVKASCTQDSGLYKGTGTMFAGQSRFDEWYPEFESQVASGTVPTFNYMILPNDHTNGTTTGDATPQAMIADNDLGSARSSTRSPTPRSGPRQRSSSSRTTPRTAPTTSTRTAAPRS